MSWKSETRRTVEDALDAYADETESLPNFVGGIEHLTGHACSTAEMKRYIDLLTMMAGDLAYGRADRGAGQEVAPLARRMILAAPAEHGNALLFVLDVIAAREIERGLLG